MLTRRWCISLQRQDEARLLHGYETGIIMRSPEGGFSERHLPISEAEGLHPHRAQDREEVMPEPGRRPTPTGSPPASTSCMKLRARLCKSWFGYNIQKPTEEELEAARHHAEHELAQTDPTGHQNLPAGDYSGQHELDGHAADGHQFDGRHEVDGEELRKH